MKYSVWKVFYDYEKEEQWINSLSAKGMHLVDYFWARYVFEDGEPGRYTYKIEFFEHTRSHPESISYLKFLDDMGIEFIASYMHWVYLRKEKNDEPFELYTDLDSQIAKMRRISRWWFTVAAFEFAMAALEAVMGTIRFYMTGQTDQFTWIFFTVLLTALGCLLVRLGLPVHRKMKKLIKEKTIYDQ